MASNQTANFGLNQWAATDKVLREEFNADNAKIDAALEALAARPAVEVIRSWENTVSGSQIDIDLSDIDLGQYLWLRVNFQNIPVTGNAGAAAYINGLNDTSLYHTGNLASTTALSATAYAATYDVTKVSNTEYSQSGEFEFDCLAPWPFGEFRSYYYDQPQQRHWYNFGRWATFPGSLSLADVSFLRLAIRSGSGEFAPGGRIVIYGQKLYQN